MSSGTCVSLQISPELADAWQQLSSLIIQEFIYDTFWGQLSPDAAFPMHTRFLLNDAFAALLLRLKKLRLHDVSCQILGSVSVRFALLSDMQCSYTYICALNLMFGSLLIHRQPRI
jgi:PXA domain